MKIYISPSNQPNNSYIIGGTNEKAQMEKVAKQVATLLEGYDCTPMLATLNLTIKKAERPKEAKEKGADVYLAIHSNAAGEKGLTKAAGAVAFYHPDSSAAKKLAAALVEELNNAAPVKSNRAESVINGMLAFDGAGYGEIRSPMEYGIPSVLVEVNFHDNLTAAQWLIDGTAEIAQAIVRALVRIFALKAQKPPTIGEENTIYRVQAGAYQVKENAMQQVERLKKLGIDAFIVPGKADK